jgi:hypothetical protein
LSALVLVGGLAFSGSGKAGPAAGKTPLPGSYREESFAADPGWEGIDNRPRTKRCTTRTFDFGWNATTQEVGGQFERSNLYRAYYAKVLPAPKTLDDPLTASGTIRVRGARGGGGGVLFGWFNSTTSYDWRTTDFFGLRVDGRGTKTQFFAEYGTENTFAGTVSTDKELTTKSRFDWVLDYQPAGGDYGAGLLRLTVAGLTAEHSLTPEQRADGATFDRFGLLNVQLDGQPMSVFVGGLTLDDAPIDLGADPGWEGSGNHLAKALDCIVHNRQDFGYSAGTAFAGGGTGEIGGVIWRSADKKASYADPTEPLGLDNVLYAEGRIVLEAASSDSDLFIGWFGRTSAARDGSVPTDLVAANLGGLSAWGYRLYPIYRSSGDERDRFSRLQDAPQMTPKRRIWQFWICYEPSADLLGNGRLSVGLTDPAGVLPATQAVIKVKQALRRPARCSTASASATTRTAAIPRSSILDDLRYTVGPGDEGPTARCGPHV